MKYIIHRKKKIKECDGMGSGDMGMPVYPNPDAPIAMGPVIPNGGPDRWDNAFKFDTSVPKRKFRVKKRKK